MSSPIDVLPQELLVALGPFIRFNDLPSFVRVSKTFNLVATPFIYRTINLTHFRWRAAKACLTLLASPPDAMMFNRSLPAYVHDLEIGYGELDAPWADEPRTPPRRRVDPLPTALIDSVIVSLVNLRSLSIDHTDGLVDLIPLFRTLITTPHVHLTSITIKYPHLDGFESDDPTESQIDVQPLPSHFPQCIPRLHKLDLWIDPPRPPRYWVETLRNVIVASSPRLRFLGFWGAATDLDRLPPLGRVCAVYLTLYSILRCAYGRSRFCALRFAYYVFAAHLLYPPPHIYHRMASMALYTRMHLHLR